MPCESKCRGGGGSPWSGKRAHHGEQGRDIGSVGAVGAAVGVDNAAIRPDYEVATHLERTLGWTSTAGEAAAAGEQAGVAHPDAGRKRRSAEAFLEAVVPVNVAFGVEQDRRGEPKVTGVPGGAPGVGRADIEDLGTKRLEFRLVTPQLRRVLTAG